MFPSCHWFNKLLLHTKSISHEYINVEIPIGPVFKLSQYWNQKSTQSKVWVLYLSEKCVWGVSDFINLQLVWLK